MRLREIVAVAFALLSCNTFAAQQRSFVSASGNDANACTLTAPCRSFAAAIAQTLAAGEVIVLDSAGYGSVAISSSISITAPPGIYAGVSVLSGDGISINGPIFDPIAVRLTGLTIVGLGGANGIFIIGNAAVEIQRCHVSGMNGDGLAQLANYSTLTIRGSEFSRNNGIGIQSSGGILIVADTVVKGNGASGLRSNSGYVSIRGSTFNLNLRGIELGGSVEATITTSEIYVNLLEGVNIAAIGQLTMSGSLVGTNGTHGIAADEARASISDSVIARNLHSGIRVTGPNSRVTLESTKIVDNFEWGINILGGVVQTLQNNTIVNNLPGDVIGSLAPISLQ